MTNEMKLLLAFIEASGYEVEEVDSTPKIEPCNVEGLRLEGFPVDDVYNLTGTVNGWYMAKDPVIYYKVTKKDVDIPL